MKQEVGTDINKCDRNRRGTERSTNDLHFIFMSFIGVFVMVPDVWLMRESRTCQIFWKAQQLQYGINTESSTYGGIAGTVQGGH